jgi:hypothetical protein
MALRAKLLRTFVAVTLLAGAGAACKKNNVKKTEIGPDPDTNSGPDAKRGGAKLMYVNKAETDSVSWPKLLRTKWKRIDIQVPGVQNILDCELRIDNTGADINIDVFNSLGTQIGFSPGPAPNKLKKLAVQIDELGTYFVRMQAAQPKDESDWSVICAWEEQTAPPDPTAPNKPHGKRPKDRSPVAKVETFQDKVDNGTEGRILSNFRDGGGMTLIIDKGTAAGVHEGTEGTVLEGRSGRQVLEGGGFKVVQVLEDSRCKATSSVRAIGKNNRVVLFK